MGAGRPELRSYPFTFPGRDSGCWFVLKGKWQRATEYDTILTCFEYTVLVYLQLKVCNNMRFAQRSDTEPASQLLKMLRGMVHSRVYTIYEEHSGDSIMVSRGA